MCDPWTIHVTFRDSAQSERLAALVFTDKVSLLQPIPRPNPTQPLYNPTCATPRKAKGGMACPHALQHIRTIMCAPVKMQAVDTRENLRINISLSLEVHGS